MFLKNRQGMETLQMIIMGLLIIALGVLFIGKFSGGVSEAGNDVNSALTTSGDSLAASVNTITNP